MKSGGNYAMHDLRADMHVACRSVWPPKGPDAIERTLALGRFGLSTDCTIVTHTVDFAAICDFQFLIELIKQAHRIVSHAKAPMWPPTQRQRCVEAGA